MLRRGIRSSLLDCCAFSNCAVWARWAIKIGSKKGQDVPLSCIPARPPWCACVIRGGEGSVSAKLARYRQPWSRVMYCCSFVDGDKSHGQSTATVSNLLFVLPVSRTGSGWRDKGADQTVDAGTGCDRRRWRGRFPCSPCSPR